MYLPDFDYYCPESVNEACEMLARFGSRAKVLAGGTDLLSKMKQALLAPEVIVSLKNIRELGSVQDAGGKGVVLGARVTHNDLVDSSILQRRYPSVSEAAHTLANNQVRNRGTVGGNIVSALPSADLPPILIALGATVTLAGHNGIRTLPLEQFFTGPNQSVIAADEILTEIVIPDQPTTGSSYYKFGLRHSGALAVVGVAAAVTMQDAVIQNIRIALGAVAPTPMRAREAERILSGKRVSEDLLEEAGRHAARECRPISDIRGSEEYRRDMVRVFTKRALRKAIYGSVSEKREVMTVQTITDKDGIKRYLINLRVNGDDFTVVVKANTLLVNILRDRLNMTGTKKGCELGNCGSCTVLLDGKPVNSCLVLALEADGHEILTIEGVAQNDQLDTLQKAFIDHAAIQCGFCTPGMILSAKALLAGHPHPTEQEVRRGIAGNLCRCTGYVNIVKAVLSAAAKSEEEV